MALVGLQTSNALDLLFSAAPTNIAAADGAALSTAGLLQESVPAAPTFAELMAQASIPLPGTLTTVVQPAQPVEIATASAGPEQNVASLDAAPGNLETIDQHSAPTTSLFLAGVGAVQRPTNAAAGPPSGETRPATNLEADIAQIEQLFQITAEPSSETDSIQTLTVLVTPPEQNPVTPETPSETAFAAETTIDAEWRATAEIPETSLPQLQGSTNAFAVAPQQTDPAVTAQDITAPAASSTIGLAATAASQAPIAPAGSKDPATGVTSNNADAGRPASAQQSPQIRLFDPETAAPVPPPAVTNDVSATNEPTAARVLTSPATAADIFPSTAHPDVTSQPTVTQQPPVAAAAPLRSDIAVDRPETGTTQTMQASVTTDAGKISTSQDVAGPSYPPVVPDNAFDNSVAATIDASKPGAPTNGPASVRVAPETGFQNETSELSSQSLNPSTSDVDVTAELSEASTRLPGNANRGLPQQAAIEQNSAQQFWASPGPLAAMPQATSRTAAGIALGANAVAVEQTMAATLNKGGTVSDSLSLGVVSNDVSVNAGPLQPAAAANPVTMLEQLGAEVLQRAESLGQDAEQRFTIRLDPPELGKLVISMKRTVHGIEMHVDAADPVTRNLIQSGLDQLDSDANDAQSVFRQLNIDVTTGDGSGRSAHDRRPAFAATPSSPMKTEDEAVEQALPDRISFVA